MSWLTGHTSDHQEQRMLFNTLHRTWLASYHWPRPWSLWSSLPSFRSFASRRRDSRHRRHILTSTQQPSSGTVMAALVTSLGDTWSLMDSGHCSKETWRTWLTLMATFSRLPTRRFRCPNSSRRNRGRNHFPNLVITGNLVSLRTMSMIVLNNCLNGHQWSHFGHRSDPIYTRMF